MEVTNGEVDGEDREEGCQRDGEKLVGNVEYVASQGR